MCMRKSLIMLTWVLSKFEVRDNCASGWELHTLFMVFGLCLSFSNRDFPPSLPTFMEMIFLLPEVCHSTSCQEETLSIEKMTHLFPSAAIWLNYALCSAPGEPSEEHEEVLAGSPSPRVFVNYHLAPTSLAKFTGMSVSQNMSGLKSESLFYFFFGATISRTIFSIKTHFTLFSTPRSLLNTPLLHVRCLGDCSWTTWLVSQDFWHAQRRCGLEGGTWAVQADGGGLEKPIPPGAGCEPLRDPLTPPSLHFPTSTMETTGPPP